MPAKPKGKSTTSKPATKKGMVKKGTTKKAAPKKTKAKVKTNVKAKSVKSARPNRATGLKGAVKSSIKRKRGEASTMTRIIIDYDCGFNNDVYIRGSGGRLSWTKGLKLRNISNDRWLYETRSQFDRCEFKVLINDTLFEEGDNRTVSSGDRVQYSPHFNR